MSYLVRTIDQELDDLLPIAPAIALDGPKGVGKTETASRRADSTWFMDDPNQRAIIGADFALTPLPPGTIVIDEWQKLPQAWDSVRRQVDAGAPPGRFILTGSATPVDAAGTHSGAGRILSLRMRPMGLHERGAVSPTVSLARLLAGEGDQVGGHSAFTLRDYADAITGSGFPAIVAAHPRLRRGLLNAYVQRIIDRDIHERGRDVRRPDTLARWLRAYAAAASTTTTYSRILAAATAGDGDRPAAATTMAYRDALTQLWLLDPLPGWMPVGSPVRRTQVAPKHQLADPALAARLLNLSASSLLSPAGAHMAGPLFESLVTLGVRVMAQAAEAEVSYLRTAHGDHEVDIIVQGFDGQILGIEVKLAAAVSDADVRHLKWLRAQLPDKVVDLMVVTTGTDAYRRPDGVAVVPLALLGA